MNAQQTKPLEFFSFCNTGKSFHRLLTGAPYCPACQGENVLEQGYEHNHRHYCRDCDIIVWITMQ